MTTKELKEIEVFKKWTKIKSFSGFISFYAWCEGDRVKVEVGETNVDSGGIKSVTAAYVGIYDFIAYLYSEVNDTIAKFYPEVAGEYGMQVFGGGETSRVLSVKAISGKPGFRWFKCGEYKAKHGSQGAIQPDYSQKISENSLQMAPSDLAALYQHLVAIQQAFETEWMMSGKTHAWIESRKSRRDFLKELRSGNG